MDVVGAGRSRGLGEWVTETSSTSLLALDGGTVVHEWYADELDADTRFLGASMTKSVLAHLVGRAVRDGALALTDAGHAFARDFGVAVAANGRRPLCKACLDWSVRRSHLAGTFGAALLERIYARGWARRVEGTRVVAFSAQGLAAFERAFQPLRAAA